MGTDKIYYFSFFLKKLMLLLYNIKDYIGKGDDHLTDQFVVFNDATN